MRDKKQPVQIKCPKCKRTQIVYIPEEDIPDCPDCRVQMNIEEQERWEERSTCPSFGTI
jgi:acetyl-CoA carboxylase beta subunit